jgi:hypothetical protein
MVSARDFWRLFLSQEHNISEVFTLKTEAIHSSETLVTTYDKTSQRHNSEDHNRHLHHRENVNYNGKKLRNRLFVNNGRETMCDLKFSRRTVCDDGSSKVL